MRGKASEHRLTVCAPSGFETRCPLQRRTSPLGAQAKGLCSDVTIHEGREHRHN
jgi:hypothetical protein